MSKVVLKCKNLSKKMKNKIIVSDINFELEEKDILGFVGPNGAGKTTIIKLILGLYKKTTGSVIINNYNLDNDFANSISNVGAIIENPDSYMYMSGLDNLMLSAKIYSISKDRVNEVVKLVGLQDSIKMKVSKYSLGMRQRLGIAQAIIHNPKILILDEPTNGLDPNGIIQLNCLLKKLSKQGMSIIISSHILSELDSLCNKFCFVKNGTIIAYKTKNELRRKKDVDDYIFELSNNSLENILSTYEIIDDNHIKISTKKKNINNVIKTLLNNKINIYEIKRESSSLEKIFLNIMEGDSNV